jgi:hypothetical protein
MTSAAHTIGVAANRISSGNRILSPQRPRCPDRSERSHRHRRHKRVLEARTFLCYGSAYFGEHTPRLPTSADSAPRIKPVRMAKAGDQFE